MSESNRLTEILNALGSENAEKLLKRFEPEQIVKIFNSTDLDGWARRDSRPNISNWLTLPRMNDGGFLVHSPIITPQDCSNGTRGSNSPSFKDSACPAVLSPFCKMFIPAFISLSSTYPQYEQT
jgi:hypothetical protein